MSKTRTKGLWSTTQLGNDKYVMMSKAMNHYFLFNSKKSLCGKVTTRDQVYHYDEARKCKLCQRILRRKT